jgi:phospholipid N-methyltransferase
VLQRQATRGADVLLFARNFFRHPRMLGSLVPSSRFLIRELLDPIRWERARVIVEYGPGVGGITAEILQRMRPDANLIAIETNSEFVSFLRSTLPDARLHVVEGSAADVQSILRSLGHERASYVISGIPFSTLPRRERQHILEQTRAVLETDGKLAVYQFSSRVLPDLERIFGYVERGFAPLNVLPAHLFFATAAAEGDRIR